ncbi:MAG: magnesium transporter [Stenotrophobium sp.]
MKQAGNNELSGLLRELRARVPVDAALLLARESPARIEQALQALPPDFAERLRAQLMEVTQSGAIHEPLPESVGELMEPARGVFPPETTAAEAIAFLRGALFVEDITYLYVVDAQGAVTGLVVMRDLLLARPQQTLAEIMLRDPFCLYEDAPLREAVQAAVKRHYPVYPVCDAQRRLAGLVRGWKLMERQVIEISAQSGRMVGVNKEERVHTLFWESFRLRHPWLQLNLLTAFLAAFVVGSFGDTIARIVVLAAFLPVLSGQSTNNGVQALAITLRGFTLGDMDDHPVRRLLVKEMLLGALNGALTGLVAAAAMGWATLHGGHPHALLLAGVIFVAMIGACMASGFFGVIVPLALKRLGTDPATASSIFLTTGTDIVSMGLMLTLATLAIPA